MDEMNKETNDNTAAEKKVATKVDKLIVLKAKHEKAAIALEKATEKAKKIQDEILAEEQKRRDKEIKQLDSICRSMKINLADIIFLIKLISENNLTINEIADLISTK